MLSSDDILKTKFGSITMQMPSRAFLSRRAASMFIFLNFYRRFLQAAIILFFYESPIKQVILSLYLNIFYTIFILVFRVTEDPIERRKDVINEFVIIVTIYFLSLFLGEFVADAAMRENLGFALIVFTMLNFSVNILPPLFNMLRSMFRYCRRRYSQS